MVHPWRSARARVWKFGDNISTDLLVPGASVLARSGSLSAEEAAQYCMSANRPGWAPAVEPGDVIVAGRNFGCGSSRNGAGPLKTLGIAAVLAESVARIHLRNSINTGLITLICPGISTAVEEGEHLSLDLESGMVRICRVRPGAPGRALARTQPADGNPARRRVYAVSSGRRLRGGRSGRRRQPGAGGVPMSARLSPRISAGQFVLAPGVHDALSALLAAEVGFDIAYMTGFGTAASLGLPDVGLVTMSEMVDNLRRITAAADIDIIADADTGYGNPINVERTVKEYERAGACGVAPRGSSVPQEVRVFRGQAADTGRGARGKDPCRVRRPPG